MKISQIVASLVGVVAVTAESLCDKYTIALFTDNTAANQRSLLVHVVNTAVIGNYSSTDTSVVVKGLLSPTVYNGEHVNLLQYFDGSLASSNRGGKCGVAINFLDGGGAAPLTMNKPADSKDSNQYLLLVHLYQFFASLLGCSIYGNTKHPYSGFPSMYEVHKFMGLDVNEFGWFVENVGLAAASFGVTSADVTTVGDALYDLFGYRDAPPESIPPIPTPTLEAICIDCSCPVSSNPDYSAYGPIINPPPAGETCGKGHYCRGSKPPHVRPRAE